MTHRESPIFATYKRSSTCTAYTQVVPLNVQLIPDLANCLQVISVAARIAAAGFCFKSCCADKLMGNFSCTKPATK